MHVGHEALLDPPAVLVQLVQELQLVVVAAAHGGALTVPTLFPVLFPIPTPLAAASASLLFADGGRPGTSAARPGSPWRCGAGLCGDGGSGQGAGPAGVAALRGTGSAATCRRDKGAASGRWGMRLFRKKTCTEMFKECS